MVRVRISDPITWHEQCTWIEENCPGYQDVTSWSAWQIGFDDIYYLVSERDAILFWLRFGK